MSAAGGSNPEYVIARVRARRASLLGEDAYRRLVRMDPAGIARFLEDDAYSAQINALGTRHGGTDLIEYALNANLAQTYRDLLGWADGQLYDLIARYLRRYDVWNIKTVLRGIYSEVDAETVGDDLILAGELEEQRLRALADLGAIEQVVEALERTVYGDALAEAYDAYVSSGLLFPLENALDRTYYDQLLTDLPGGQQTRAYVEFLTAEVDFTNIINMLRLSRSGAALDPAAYFLDGGALFRLETVDALVQNPDELLATIRESAYGDRLSGMLAAVETGASLIPAEHAVEAALLETADSLGYENPLSITPVLSFILAKRREVDNIRAIARGREAGLDVETLESEVVIV